MMGSKSESNEHFRGLDKTRIINIIYPLNCFACQILHNLLLVHGISYRIV